MRKSMDNILSCFGGEDGGVRFAKLKFWVEGCEKEAKEGKESAIVLLELIDRFSKLIDTVAGDRSKYGL
jgi:hypothetical protein